MAKVKRFTSIENASAAESGEGTKTAGHDELGLLVIADNLESGSDTLDVRAEGSAENKHYAPINVGTTGQDNVLQVTASDFVQSDDDPNKYVAYIAAHNIPVEFLRANIVSFTDSAGSDLSVTAYLFMGGWTGRGKSYANRDDVPKPYTL